MLLDGHDKVTFDYMYYSELITVQALSIHPTIITLRGRTGPVKVNLIIEYCNAFLLSLIGTKGLAVLLTKVTFSSDTL